MKKYLILLQLFFFVGVYSQNKKIVYGFDKIPQTLLLNPGAETTFKYHVGIPMLSGISANVSTSGITVADLFRNDRLGIFSGSSFTQKIKKALTKLGDNDYAHLNTQIDVLNLGYKINNTDYLSGGFYIEADAFVAFPKDVAILLTEGNANYIEKVFSLGQFSSKSDLLGVWHVGLSKRMNSKLTVGGRFKIYSGVINGTSTNNSGGISTHKLDDDLYEYVFSGINLSLLSSGIYNDANKAEISMGKAIGKSFFSSNLGLGIDLGFTYHINEQSEITGSLLDLGFVSYSNQIRNYQAKGNYITSGFQLDLLDVVPRLWNIDREFDDSIERKENKDSYTVMRPLKAYGAYSYSFGKSKNRANCHDDTYKDFFDTTIGGQIYAALQPNGMNLAFTGFYQRKISKYFNTKVTYTIDDFSYTNFGIGLSVNLWKLNVYGVLDNILTITDIADGHTSSAQLGVNFIIN